MVMHKVGREALGCLGELGEEVDNYRPTSLEQLIVDVRARAVRTYDLM